MWVVVEINKKQYLIQKDATFEVERLKEKEGEVSFDKVLLFSDEDKVEIGKPYLPGFAIKCQVLGEEKDDKVLIYKFRRRKKYRRKRGHRQIHTRLKFSDIIIPKK